MPDIVLRALQPDAANGAVRVVQETTAPLPGLHMFVGSTGGNPSGSDVVLRQQSWHPLPAVTPAGGGTTHDGAASITAAATVAASGAAIRGGAASISGSATVSAGASAIRGGAASVTSTGTVTAAAAALRGGAAAVAASVTVTPSGSVLRGGAASITATAEVTADGRILRSSSGAGTYGRPRRRRHPTPAKTSQAHAALVLALLQEEYAL